jgi:hypothetical protein
MPVIAVAGSTWSIDPGDPWHITIALCIIGTIILFGYIYYLSRKTDNISPTLFMDKPTAVVPEDLKRIGKQ